MYKNILIDDFPTSLPSLMGFSMTFEPYVMFQNMLLFTTTRELHTKNNITFLMILYGVHSLMGLSKKPTVYGPQNAGQISNPSCDRSKFKFPNFFVVNKTSISLFSFPKVLFQKFWFHVYFLIAQSQVAFF